MADAGRPRKPLAVKERQGTVEKSRESTAEPAWPAGKATMPTGLKGEARREWKRIVPLLIAQGLFPASAYRQVEGICRRWGRFMEAEKALEEEGKIDTTQSGYRQPSPWIAIGNKAWDDYMTACGRFGLDPASAGKVTARPPVSTTEDELAKARAERRANR